MQKQAEAEKQSHKIGRKSKQSDALRLYKQKRTRNCMNILRFAKERLMDGMTKDELTQALMDNYGIAERTAETYYRRANELVTYSMVWDADTIRNKNIQRLNEIAEEAKEGEDFQNAIKAIDVLNKTANVYIEKKEVTLDGSEISFTFGTGEAK